MLVFYFYLVYFICINGMFGLVIKLLNSLFYDFEYYFAKFCKKYSLTKYIKSLQKLGVDL